MYTYFQPRISVTQEEDNIKAMIDEEYEHKEQENRDYYKYLEEYNSISLRSWNEVIYFTAFME